MTFWLLGPMEVSVGGERLDVGHPRQRCVLAVLLVDANRYVPAERLISRVWGDEAPATALELVYGYVSRLRRCLASTACVLQSRREAGYLLQVDPATVDLHRFREIAAAARGSRDDDQASAHYREGLQLWRGEAFADLASPWLDRMSQTLRRERLTAELKRNDIELRRGRYAGLLSSLASLAQSHPLDERVTGQIMLAAYLNGRQADALGYYQQTRRRLIGELGIEPGPDLRELHQKILRGEADATPSGSVASREPRSLVPRQLPHDQVHFTGRRDELRRLDALNADSKADAKRVTSRRRHIVLITGPGGVGKTALAVHFGHAAASQFPDGQLYVDLRGYDPRQPKLSAGEVLGRFLRAFDIEPERIPVNIDERAALFRTVVAGKSVLVVLDNAASPEQIRPLLPGHHGCLVVVTSRNRLAGLAARDDASRIPLSVLPPGDAVALLSATIGGERFTTEPGAAAELAHLCGYLPLALRVAAERVAAEPSRAIGELLHDLSDQHRRLDGLGAEGDEITGVRLAFCWSFRAISGDAARVFRLLGVHATAEYLGARRRRAGGPHTRRLPQCASNAGRSASARISGCGTLRHARPLAYLCRRTRGR